MPVEDVQAAVREKYGDIARSVGKQGCCGPVACGCGDPISSHLYSDEQTAGLPEEAVAASLGCGNPTALVELQPGQTVLDLGSGGGIDVLLSARRVGPTGKVYGLDMTDDMLALARENQRKAGAANVEFIKGTIEAMPLPDSSIDVDRLQLRDQSLDGQGRRAARGVPRAEAGRTVCRLRCRHSRRSAAGRPSQHGALGRLHRRRARRAGVHVENSGPPGSPTWRWIRGGCMASRTRGPFSPRPGSTWIGSRLAWKAGC